MQRKGLEGGGKQRRKDTVCVYACILFFFRVVHVHKHVSLAGRLEGLRTSLDKQTLCRPHLFTSYSPNYTCSPRNRSDNRSTVPQKQKYRIVEQLIGQLLVYFMALLVQICITLCLPWLVIVRGWLGLGSFSFYFCSSVMTEMGFINAQFDSHRQTNAGCDLYVVVCWCGPLKPILSWCGRRWNLLATLNMFLWTFDISPKVLCCLLINQSFFALDLSLLSTRDI